MKKCVARGNIIPYVSGLCAVLFKCKIENMKKKKELKPIRIPSAGNGTKPIVVCSCPFCGCKPKITRGKDETTPMLISSFKVDIQCLSKKCKVHPSLHGYNRFAHSKEECQNVVNSVIAEWNKRA